MAPDLTGQVVKAEAHYFTVGGSADIWRGMMMSTNKDCSERRVVWTCHIFVEKILVLIYVGSCESLKRTGRSEYISGGIVCWSFYSFTYIFTHNQKIVPEIRVWDVVQHPNITPFLGVSLDFDGPQTPCLVSPYYRNGDIMTYLKAHQNVEILPLVSQFSSFFEDIDFNS